MKKKHPTSLIRYSCSVCKKDEVVWNSQEGYVPNVIRCPVCGGDSYKKVDCDVVVTPEDYNPKTFRWIVYTSKEEYEGFLRKTKLSIIEKSDKEDIIRTLVKEYDPYKNPVVTDKFNLFES